MRPTHCVRTVYKFLRQPADGLTITLSMYLPRQVMSPVHRAPQDSVRLFRGIKAKIVVRMLGLSPLVVLYLQVGLVATGRGYRRARTYLNHLSVLQSAKNLQSTTPSQGRYSSFSCSIPLFSDKYLRRGSKSWNSKFDKKPFR